MAPQGSYKPWRALVALGVLIVALAVWAFFPGTDHSVKLGLDLQGGTQVILLPKPVKAGTTITDEQLKQTVSIIRQRVDGLGVAEAEVTTQGSGEGAAIVVSVPGVQQDRLVDLVQRTALLDFRPVYAELAPMPASAASPAASASASPTPSSSASASAAPASSAAATPEPTASPIGAAAAGAKATGTIVQSPDNSPAYQEKLAALDCTNAQVRAGGTPDDPEQWLGTCEKSGAAKFNLQPAFIKGTSITGATAGLAQGGIGWVVSLQFDGEGAKALADASRQLTQLPECSTGQSPCNAFAIVLDGVVVSAPRFNEAILGGQAQIEGNFTATEANDLANVLKYGALPVTLEVADITSVSPTVGADQLRAGVLAGLLGLALVIVYLLFYYRALGVIAAFSLVVAAVVTYGVLVVMGKSIGLTLTLAGVAGAIVAIGITADSFIVYFERIRDEIREGRSLRQACDTGWVRARRTILAADFVSILAALVLYIVSVGSVRGFAFVLGLTTLIDILIAFWFTHPLVVLSGRAKWMQTGAKWTGLAADRIGAPSVIGTIARQGRARGAKEVSS